MSATEQNLFSSQDYPRGCVPGIHHGGGPDGQGRVSNGNPLTSSAARSVNSYPTLVPHSGPAGYGR
jgi:hypothetical protein